MVSGTEKEAAEPVASILSQVKRILILLAGTAVLLLGVVMLVAPGPGIVTIALGLAILASEFVWAKRLLARFRHEGRRVRDLILRRPDRQCSTIVERRVPDDDATERPQ